MNLKFIIHKIATYSKRKKKPQGAVFYCVLDKGGG